MGSSSQEFSVRFWGVRGSISCPGPDTVRYGGNTSCLEMRCGDRTLIFDAGTGLRPLGAHLDALGPVEADLFFTHTHFDHICGLPFFSSAYAKTNKFRLLGGPSAARPHAALRAVRDDDGAALPDPDQRARRRHLVPRLPLGRDAQPRRPARPSRPPPLNHPNGATGYRVEHAGKSICYVTDTEHVPGRPDQAVLGLIADADIVIYDSTYDDGEFAAHVGWGHSTWQEGIRLADAARVKQLVIFHHDPGHDDAEMDRIAAAADKARPGTLVAHEGMILKP